MSKGLVIGAAGFVGSYLIEEMYSCGMEISATKLPMSAWRISTREFMTWIF